MHAAILRYFTTVAELGTIREASGRLHVSASAINRQILNLEELIGEPVFERRRTGMQLTEAGEIVFATAVALSRTLLGCEAKSMRGVDGSPAPFGSSRWTA